MNGPRSTLPLKPSDIDETIRTFAKKFGRSPTLEELACLDYARKLLCEKPAIANNGNVPESEEMSSSPSLPQASGTTEASG